MSFTVTPTTVISGGRTFNKDEIRRLKLANPFSQALQRRRGRCATSSADGPGGSWSLRSFGFQGP